MTNTEDGMLVLSRKINEKIVISGGIVVTVLDIKGGKVRFGVEAPDHVEIDREEVDERKRGERRMLD